MRFASPGRRPGRCAASRAIRRIRTSSGSEVRQARPWGGPLPGGAPVPAERPASAAYGYRLGAEHLGRGAPSTRSGSGRCGRHWTFYTGLSRVCATTASRSKSICASALRVSMVKRTASRSTSSSRSRRVTKAPGALGHLYRFAARARCGRSGRGRSPGWAWLSDNAFTAAFRREDVAARWSAPQTSIMRGDSSRANLVSGGSRRVVGEIGVRSRPDLRSRAVYVVAELRRERNRVSRARSPVIGGFPWSGSRGCPRRSGRARRASRSLRQRHRMRSGNVPRNRRPARRRAAPGLRGSIASSAQQ